MFRFQRHSDHHLNAYKVFTTLDLTKEMPVFPFGFYEGMYMCVLPPLWYYVMDPYVDEALGRKKVSESHRRIVFWIMEVFSLFIVSYLAMQVYRAYALRNP